VRLDLKSTVGVLLDDFPAAHRAELIKRLQEAPDAFWFDRARRQLRLTSMRLSFRNAFYPAGTKWQLPLPPEEQWVFTLEGRPSRQVVEGHDVLAVPYHFSGILLSDVASPGTSEPALGTTGGTWEEPFIFPVDPEFLFQRTEFACINEGQFPPLSVDAEEVDLFYDHGCTAETRLSTTGCHQTELPQRSCVQALREEVGSIRTAMRFERLPWSAEVAAGVRRSTLTTNAGPDLVPDAEGFRQHRFSYRYIPASSCTLEEACVGGPGWRKLLLFPTADLNAGNAALDIGWVDYFHKEGGSVLSKHGVFEYSACHNHYHFMHYGRFQLGDGSTGIARKNGFCMQPTERTENHELSPLHHPYIDCLNQGVSVGWIDEYKMGLECQWMDVTDVPSARTLPLTFETNPEGLLCEGTLARDAQGEILFEPSALRTTAGQPVEQPVCTRTPGWQANNTTSHEVTILPTGEGYVTQPCRTGLFGSQRNCGFRASPPPSSCTPGTTVELRCSTASTRPQVVRVCEGSRALGIGLPCTANEALASVTLDGTGTLRFTCPAARDAVETGGTYGWLTGPLFPDDARADITCVAEEA
jgi:hypothetical protein